MCGQVGSLPLSPLGSHKTRDTLIRNEISSMISISEEDMFILPVSLEGLTKLALGGSRRHSIFKHLLVDSLARSAKPLP